MTAGSTSAAAGSADGKPVADRRLSVALLLAQLGAHGAARFAERLRPLGLTPAHAGVLRLLRDQEGLSQRELAAQLRAAQSRVVALLDELEARDLVARERREGDRRTHALRLTHNGRRIVADLRQIADAHEAETTACLSSGERHQLASLLYRLVESNGLTPGVHPGYGAGKREST